MGSLLYHYSLAGAYITTEDALNSSITAEDIWTGKDYERAISLVAVRSLFYERAKGLIGSDVESIHGTNKLSIFYAGYYRK